MSRIGIELLSVFGLPPVEYVTLAADLGTPHISAGLERGYFNPHGYADWSLRDDAKLRREMKAALKDRGVTISLGEGFIVRPNVDLRERGEDLDIFAELGAERISAVAFDPDLNRSMDQIAAVTEMAAGRGLKPMIEFAPRNSVGTLAGALKAAREVGHGCTVCVDAMHLIRSGGSPEELAAADPRLIGYAQICDVPLIAPHDNYMKEACGERLDPGAGELPLQAIIAALPRDIPLGLEVPKMADAEAGIGPFERLKPSVNATKRLLAALDG